MKKKRLSFLLLAATLLLLGCQAQEPTQTENSTAHTSLDTTPGSTGTTENTTVPTDAATEPSETQPPETEPEETEPAETLPEETEPVDWVTNLQAAADTHQLLIVAAEGNTAAISLHFRGEDGRWSEVLATTGFVGKNGIGKTREGDGKTPTGIFGFTLAFGTQPDPGTAYPYTQLDGSHYWVDDPSSAYYNQFVSTDSVAADWSSAEHLADYPTAYRYALALDYNSEGVPGLGSAIFLHCSTGRGTAGCIAVPESDMLRLLQLLQPGALVIIDTPDGVYNY